MNRINTLLTYVPYYVRTYRQRHAHAGAGFAALHTVFTLFANTHNRFIDCVFALLVCGALILASPRLAITQSKQTIPHFPSVC